MGVCARLQRIPSCRRKSSWAVVCSARVMQVGSSACASLKSLREIVPSCRIVSLSLISSRVVRQICSSSRIALDHGTLTLRGATVGGIGGLMVVSFDVGFRVRLMILSGGEIPPACMSCSICVWSNVNPSRMWSLDMIQSDICGVNESDGREAVSRVIPIREKKSANVLRSPEMCTTVMSKAAMACARRARCGFVAWHWAR